MKPELSNFVDLLTYRTAENPQKVVFTFLPDGETAAENLTYQQLETKARAIAAYLQSLKAEGERALLLYPPGLEFITAFLGCLYAGAIAVPAYPPRANRSLPRLQAIVSDAQASLALTAQALASTIEGKLTQSLSTETIRCITTDGIDQQLSENWQPFQINPDNIAFLQYTSGSTGTPKGVMVSHENLIHNSGLINRCFQDTADSSGVSWLPPYHDMGLIGGILQPIYVGASMVLMPPVTFLQRPLRWLQAISHYRVTTSGAPNFAYDLCASQITSEQREELDLSSWRLAFTGAEPVRAATLEKFAETFSPCGFQKRAFYPCYGMAETTLIVSGGLKEAPPICKSFDHKKIEQNQVRLAEPTAAGSLTFVGCGQAVASQQIVIVNPETLTPCQPDEIGEIWVSGKSVTQGYWNRQQQTAESFKAYLADTQEGPFLRTGDLGFLHEGELFVTGRLKDLIIIRGRNHYPQDIELTVENSHPAIREASGAAFAVDVGGEEQLGIAVEIKRSHRRKLKVEEVTAAIRKAVAENHELQPYAIVLLKTGSIPKTSSGKIQRHACKAGFLAGNLSLVGEWKQGEFRGQSPLNSPEKGSYPPTLQGGDKGGRGDKNQALTSKHQRASTNEQQHLIQTWLVDKIAQKLGISRQEIAIREPFISYGLDSLQAVQLSAELEDWLGRKLSPTLAYDYPSIESLAAYLGRGEKSESQNPARTGGTESQSESQNQEYIAIVGLGCRFPQANNPAAFWKLLSEGKDAITPVKGRWSGKDWGGFLEQIDQFDPQFFGISPREAQGMDPQQRLLLEVSWEALENAGIAADRLAGSATGVFIGISSSDYSQVRLRSHLVPDPYAGTGNAHSIAANRLSYLLDFRGPSLTVDTACSSSLVAVHLAVKSLQGGECDRALAGGVNLMLSPELTQTFTQAGMLAPDGRCKTFDANADGYGRGEGCGAIVLKRLSDAERDGDNILAVIRGSAINQDGRSNGLTAPNGLSQQAVIREALATAGVTPAAIGYLEAHGTGTALGDPIEVNSLKTVFMAGRTLEQPLYIGSVKTNIGHLEAAAGIAGLIKVVLSLQYQEIPPHLHFQSLNPHIDLTETAITIPTQGQSWPQGGQPRLAGVSSFGFGGTNAHVVVEEFVGAVPPCPPPKIERNWERPLQLLTLSAKNEFALQDLVKSYEDYLTSVSKYSLPDICFTANTGRYQFNHRLAVIAESTEQLREKLAAFRNGQETAGILAGKIEPGTKYKIAFLFSGQGSQYLGMGRQLYETQPTFKNALDRCAKILDHDLDQPLLEILYPGEESNNPKSTSPTPLRKGGIPNLKLNQTAYTQPALFALEYALAQLWLSWGIQPTAMIGHSVGEYVAACLAGVFSLEDGLKLIAHRAKLMQSLPKNGAMVAVLADEVTINKIINLHGEKIAIAAFNGRENLVISGEKEAIKKAVADLEAKGIKTKQLEVSHAFHSPLMEPMLAEFGKIAREINYSLPTMEIISNVTGQVAGEEITSGEYWVQHIIQPVRFAASLEYLASQGYEIFLEIGPKPVLLGMAKTVLETSPHSKSYNWLPSLRPGQEDWQQMLTSLATLTGRGIEVNWAGFERDYPRQKVWGLPTYPFQRQRYWIEANSEFQIPNSEFNRHPFFSHKLTLADSEKIYFQGTISQNSPAFSADHRIYDRAIVPGTAYLEMAITAAAITFQSEQLVVENVAIQQPLVLPADEREAVAIQVILNPEGEREASWQVYSGHNSEVGAEEENWILHASGKVSVIDSPLLSPPFQPVDLTALQAQHSEILSVSDYYQKLRDRGINYGHSFQGIEQIWQGKTGALGAIRLPEDLRGEVASYHCHPVLLDATFQLVGALVVGRQDADSTPEDSETLYLPLGLEKLQIYQSLPSRFWCQVQDLQFKGTNQELLSASLQLYDETGTVIARLSGLSLARVNRQTLLRSLQKDLSDWLYDLTWQLQPREKPAELATKSGTWLILAGKEEDLSLKITALLEEKGESCLLVFPGAAYEKLDSSRYTLNPTEMAEFQQLFQDITGENKPSLRGIIHLWSLETKSATEASLSSLQQAQKFACGSALSLLQAIVKTRWQEIPRLWLVTQGTQVVATHPTPIDPSQASLWGLGRVIALEHPELRCTRLDLSPTVDAAEITSLVQELSSPDGEDQIAWRGEGRYVARLAKYGGKAQAASPSLAQPFQLKTSGYGLLENLTFAPLQRRQPQAGEVEIAVRATGLNFRDVLNALGMLKDYTQQLGIDSAAELPFGGECAGTVVAVGEGVTEFQVGEGVIAALAPGSLSSHITVKADLVVSKPQNLTFEEAATISTAFLTAHYGLRHLAQLKPGDRVLIHAAAGGVGQAAVQLAQQAGAEVFATASPGKWDFLQSLGIDKVMNSRNLDFAAEIMNLTGGEGVNLVLNSLNGEFIPKSLEILAPGGRFVEIGRIGLWDAGQVREKRPDVAYFTFDLLEVAAQNPQLIGEILHSLCQELAKGALQPLPRQVFPIPDVVSAFRHLAQAKHIGKVVVSVSEEGQIQKQIPSPPIREDGTYLITGGLGALGRQVADWLAGQGARYLVLVGRSQLSPAAQEAIDTLTGQGIQVSAMQADIAQPEEVKSLLAEVQASLPPLKGIIHAAGVLDDGVLLQQTWPRFQKVMNPKLAGAWNLHCLTQEMPLDFFVCFSSMASLLGSPGQGNYAAANAFLDALAHYRRSLGLPGLSINWGPWAEGGMAAASGSASRWAAQGLSLIEPESGLQLLGDLLTQETTEVAVLPINWPQFQRQFPPGLTIPFLENWVSRKEETRKVAAGKQPELLQKLQSIPTAQRRYFLLNYLRSLVAKVLNLPSPEQIEPRQRLFDLGLDSLMAVELKNYLETNLGQSIPTTLLFDYPTLEALADYLHEFLGQREGEDEKEEFTQVSQEKEITPTIDAEFIISLAEEEAEALLIKELEEMNF